MTLEVIVLAAGKGTRMRSALPKVMHDLAGRPLLDHVLETISSLSAQRIHVVCGYGAEIVRKHVGEPGWINWVAQVEQLGTGHAVQQALPQVADDAIVLVVYGDVPLVRTQTLGGLLAQAGTNRLALLTAQLPNPSGYGRIVRNEDSQVIGIVEERDASADELDIGEINTGFMAAPAAALRRWLAMVGSGNDQGEYYLTDIISCAVHEDIDVVTVSCVDGDEVLGVNSRGELAVAERLYQTRQAESLMAAGLTLHDPARFDLRGQLHFGEDCEIDVNVVIKGTVTLGTRVRIGPNCQITDSKIGNGVEVRANSVIEGAEMAENCTIGPFARLRAGTKLAAGARVGNFVETKNTTFGRDSKASHLAYLGDAQVGQRANIGAGVITCNYDGADKHQTVIGDDAFIGSNSALVAPVQVGDGATVGAGSAISRDVPSGELALTRAEQKTQHDWRRPQKKKTE